MTFNLTHKRLHILRQLDQRGPLTDLQLMVLVQPPTSKKSRRIALTRAFMRKIIGANLTESRYTPGLDSKGTMIYSITPAGLRAITNARRTV